jgi:hypothetical protein
LDTDRRSVSGRSPVRRKRRSKLWFLGATLGSALALFVVASLTVFAGEGNSDYLGTLSSTAPSGYVHSPSWYDLSKGQDTVTFHFTVTNKTAEQQSMTLQLNLNHIITYRGQNVSDGQPGVTNGAIVDGQFDETQSTQVQDASPTFTPFTIAPSATETLTMSRTLQAGACGYYQADVAKSGLMGQKGLVGLEIRVLGCTAAAGGGTSPSPTPSGGGVGGGTSSPSPTPGPTSSGGTPPGGETGAVSAATATPSGVQLANTGLPILAGLAGLLLLGAGGVGFWNRRK